MDYPDYIILCINLYYGLSDPEIRAPSLIGSRSISQEMRIVD